jgi:CRISPR/Cas system-associated protein Csm6
MLLTAENVVTVPPVTLAPDAYDRWLVRDLVETAWAIANRKHPPADADWTGQARWALERLAWRLLERRNVRGETSQDVFPPILTSREG